MGNTIVSGLMMMGLAASPIWADVTGLARLSFEAQKDGAQWLEGFAKSTDGQALTYNSHRNANGKARIARALNDVMTWETAVVPDGAAGKPVTFLWIAGMANKGTGEEFILKVDGVERFRFKLDQGWGWTVKGKEGGELSWAAAWQDSSDDLFGYMKLTLPAQWVKPSQAVSLQVVGGGAKSRNWVMVFEFADAAAGLLKESGKDVFHQFINGGPSAGMTQLAAREAFAGKTAAIRAGKRELAQPVFKASGGVATAVFAIRPEDISGPLGMLDVVVDDKVVARIDSAPVAKLRMKVFLDQELEFDRYVFPPGALPKASWKNPQAVKLNMGAFDLDVAFYDAKMQKVESADQPGRYGAVVSAKTPDGFTMKRYVTLFCTAEELHTWSDRIALKSERFAKFGISQEAWRGRQDAIDRELGAMIIRQAEHDPIFAAALAGLSEIGADDKLPAHEAVPHYRDRQWWVSFKDRQTAHEARSLAGPQKLDAPAPVLREGKPQEAGFTQAQVDQIDGICQEWAKEADEPMAVLVACRGIIVLHKAYGTAPDGKPMTVDTPTWMASITKLLSGTLMMQFVDQGLVGIDEPIRKYLPEFDRPTKTPLTARHLFTHTAGFETYGSWGMDWSHSFDNAVAQYLPFLEPGTHKTYNGNSYGVAGKVMEAMSGRCLPYLFQEKLFVPLGASNTTIDDCGGSTQSTCMDMARVAQMLLQKGQYGQYRFFSEKTYEKMLPVDLEPIIGIKGRHGIGMTYEDSQLLGHGAASGAIFRIWPEKQLLFIASRNRPGPKYDVYSKKLINACRAPFMTATAPATQPASMPAAGPAK